MLNKFIFQREMPPIRKLLLMHLAAGGKLVQDFVSNNPAVFVTDVAKPLVSLYAMFNPVQSSGTPSPENILPITGRTGVNVYHSGEDTSDPDTYPVTFPCVGINLFDISSIMSGTLDGNGNYTENPSKTVSDYITLPAGTYVFSRVATANTHYWKAFSYTLDNVKIKKLFDYGAASMAAQFTLEEESKIRIAFDYIVTADDKVQLEKGTYPSAYEPYTTTLFGGYVDIVSGILTKTWVSRPMKSMRWGNFSGFYVFIAQEQKNKYSMPLCDCYPVVTGNPSVDQTVGAYANGASYAGSIMFYKSGMTSVQDFNDWLASLDYDPHIAYQLETAETYQLTPQEVTSLIGTNTVWSDANGDCYIEYLKKG